MGLTTREIAAAFLVGRADGAGAGLAVLEPVLASAQLDDYAPLHTAHADLLAQAGERDAARAGWIRAAQCADNKDIHQEMLHRTAP